VKRPSSAPGKKRKTTVRVLKEVSERDVTHQLIQSSIARSESSSSLQQRQQQQQKKKIQQQQRQQQNIGVDMGCEVPTKKKKGPKKFKRPKSAATRRSKAMIGQSSVVMGGKRMTKTPNLGIGTQFYTSK
jgi:hypothetical protein